MICPCCGQAVESEPDEWAALSASQRIIMEALTKAKGKSVSMERLIALVWWLRDEPDEAAAQIRVQVLRIRRKIGDVVENTYGGYRLRSPENVPRLSLSDVRARKAGDRAQSGREAGSA